MALARALLLLTLGRLAAGRYDYGGYNGGSSPYSSGGGGSSSNSASDYNNDGNGGFDVASQYLGFDPVKAEHIRLAHGVLASAAFVFFFPVGAISIRVISHRAAIWIHAAFQIFAYVLYITAFGLGIWMVTKIKFQNFDLLSNSATNYHPIIGIVLFAFLFFQPILGVLHHLAFKKHQRRQLWSYAHLWLGRLLITLGIINGGLGLRLADNTRAGEVAYGVVAGVVWLVWVAAAVYGEVKRARAQRRVRGRGRGGATYKRERGLSDGGEEAVAGVDGAAAQAPGHAPPMSGPRMYR